MRCPSKGSSSSTGVSVVISRYRRALRRARGAHRRSVAVGILRGPSTTPGGPDPFRRAASIELRPAVRAVVARMVPRNRHMTDSRRGRRVLRLASRPVSPLISSVMGVRTDHDVAALTFDDGPDSHHTMRILETLRHHGATATFFVLAQRAVRLPDVMKAIQDGGHEIGLHGDDHSPLIDCSIRSKVAKISGGKRRLQSMIHEPVRFFRPPYGWQDLRGFVTVRLVGLQVIAWTSTGGNWLDITPSEVADRATAGFERGAIVLLHDRCEPSPGHPNDAPAANLDRAAAVDELLHRAALRRIEIVSVGELLTAGSRSPPLVLAPQLDPSRMDSLRPMTILP